MLSDFAKEKGFGILLCFSMAVVLWLLVREAPVLRFIGAPILAILAGMAVSNLVKDRSRFAKGASFTSKYILQTAVVLLGFGLNLATVGRVGLQSLPVIVCTISTSLIVAFALYKIMKASLKTSALVGIGSSICGGSAIVAAAPVVEADDQEVAQAISVVFLFNVIAAVVFPTLGEMLGMSGQGFALFAGTAINDTSSVTAAAATWDAMHGTTDVLDGAAIVKLTRTLFIVPIVVALSFVMARRTSGGRKGGVAKAFPKFVLFFLVASLVTTVFTSVLSGDALEASEDVFAFLKQVSAFLIIMAMAGVGLGTDVVKLVRSGAKPLAIGLCCWIAIAVVSLTVQALIGIW